MYGIWDLESCLKLLMAKDGPLGPSATIELNDIKKPLKSSRGFELWWSDLRISEENEIRSERLDGWVRILLKYFAIIILPNFERSYLIHVSLHWVKTWWMKSIVLRYFRKYLRKVSCNIRWMHIFSWNISKHIGISTTMTILLMLHTWRTCAITRVRETKENTL